MYRECYQPNAAKVCLLPNTVENEFSIRISKLILENQKSFQSFSEIADKEIDLRIINLKVKIEK